MKPDRFILIDDDVDSNTLCKLYIRRALPEMKIMDFALVENGLTYVQTVINEERSSSILLLDINMPTISGWEFLEKFNEMQKEVKSEINIYIISSSIDSRDMEKASLNPFVKGYLEKPLEMKVIKKIYDDLN